MLCFDLTVTFMIMINAVIFNCNSEARTTVQNSREATSSQVSLSDQSYHQDKHNFVKSSLNEIFRKHRRIKSNFQKNWYLDPIVVKLSNVIGKYNVKKEEIEAAYSGVVACGEKKCGQFLGLIPNRQRAHRMKFCERKKIFKQKVLNSISNFHTGVQKILESFEVLAGLERRLDFRNETRRKILKELKAEIKNLKIEIETVMINKRLQCRNQVDGLAVALLSYPKSQTQLIIYEWRVIQESKRYLLDWKGNFHGILKCWKKKRREERRRRRESLRKFASFRSPGEI